MTQINLKLSRNVFTPKLFPLLEDYSARIMMFKGSAGSGKSYFISQRIIYRCLKERIRVLVCRRYGTTLRNSCFQLFKEILTFWNIIEYCKIRETDMSIKFPNGSEIIFIGLDDEGKLLSLADISTIFVEEVFEVEQSKWDQLNLRMRGQAKNQQLIGAFNPISKSHWLYDYCVVNPPDSFIFSETTYKDNPFLKQEYINAIESYKERNPWRWNIYGLGNWGNDPEGLVFTNWRKEEFDVQLLSSSGLERRAGMDVGFVDPTAIIKSLFDKANRRIYVYDEYYAPGKQLEEIAAQMENMELRHQKLYVDSADPRAITYFRQKGFNTVPCIKGQGSVEAGISFLQNMEIIVLPKCVNFLNELENFSYIKDKKTERYTEKMTHEFSHAVDACRYAYSDIYTNRALKSFDIGLLGL